MLFADAFIAYDEKKITNATNLGGVLWGAFQSYPTYIQTLLLQKNNRKQKCG